MRFNTHIFSCKALTIPTLFYINRIFRSTIETTQQQIVDAFKTFTARDDIAVLLISQNVRSRADGK